MGRGASSESKTSQPEVDQSEQNKQSTVEPKVKRGHGLLLTIDIDGIAGYKGGNKKWKTNAVIPMIMSEEDINFDRQLIEKLITQFADASPCIYYKSLPRIGCNLNTRSVATKFGKLLSRYRSRSPGSPNGNFHRFNISKLNPNYSL